MKPINIDLVSVVAKPIKNAMAKPHPIIVVILFIILTIFLKPIGCA